MFLNSYVNGLTLGSFVYILGRCLDMTLSAESYLKLMAENGELLNDGLKASRKNLLGIGPVIYSVVDVMCVNHTLYFSFMQPIMYINSRVYLFCFSIFGVEVLALEK